MYRTAAFIALLTALAAPSAAQDKPIASEAAPAPQDEQGFVDKARGWAEDHQLAERLSGDIDGWYPRLGGMTRGSGFALGPGYRFHVGSVLVDTSAAMSMKMYKAVDVNVRWLQAYNERVELWTGYRFEDFPQEDFWRMGADSPPDTRTSYDYDSHDVAVQGIVKPWSWLRAGATVGLKWPSIGPGSDNRYPSIERLFTDLEAPGLDSQPTYLRTGLFADADTRDEPGHPRSGGLYRVSVSVWDARNDSPYDFRRLDINAHHFVPLVPSKNHVISGRLGLAYVNNETGDRVPFYFLPYVGGTDTVRSFREFRFKDENAIWLGAEYNYRPMKWVSLAAFVDRGKVAHDWEDANLSDLETGYGFGFRVHNRRQVFLRFDYGMGGGEGHRFFIKLGGF